MKKIYTPYDERHTIFSRVRLKPNTQNYRDFYHAHPHLKKGDDSIRGMDFMQNIRKDETFKQTFLPLIDNDDKLINAYHDITIKTPVTSKQNLLDKTQIKALLKSFGAIDSGIVTLRDEHYYTHHGGVNEGLGLDNYGKSIKARYRTAIVYIISMDKKAMQRAPHFEEMLETKNGYQKIANIGTRLTLFLKSNGYRTLLQSEAYYITPLVPLAYDAGLGEIGMSNHIIHPQYGDRIRIGAVLTDLTLKPDTPIHFGLRSFCAQCGLCLINCPNQAIKHKRRIVYDRVFYHFDEQSCFKIFKTAGTDCGVCIQSCPFSYHIDEKTIQWMENDSEKIDQTIKKHIAKNGRRPCIKQPLDILRGEKHDENNH